MKTLLLVFLVVVAGCGQNVQYPNSKIYVCNDMGTIRYEEFGPDPIQGPVDPSSHPCTQEDFAIANSNGGHWSYSDRRKEWINGKNDCLASVNT